MLDVPDATIGVHQLLGPDHDVLVVPAEGHEQVALGCGGGRHQVARLVRMNGEGLLHEHVCPGLQGGLGLLVVPPNRAGHDHNVRLGVQHPGVVGVRRSEAESGTHALRHHRIPAVDGHELHLIGVLLQARQV